MTIWATRVWRLGERLRILLKCVPTHLITPSLCGCSRRNASFSSPKRLDACCSNVQLLSPKRPTRFASLFAKRGSSRQQKKRQTDTNSHLKKLSPKRLSPKLLVAQTSVHLLETYTRNIRVMFSHLEFLYFVIISIFFIFLWLKKSLQCVWIGLG